MSTPQPSRERQLVAFQTAGAPVLAGLVLGVLVAVLIGGGGAIVLIGIGLGVIAAAIIFGRRIWAEPLAGPTPAPLDPAEAPTDEHDAGAG